MLYGNLTISLQRRNVKELSWRELVLCSEDWLINNFSAGPVRKLEVKNSKNYSSVTTVSE